MLNAGFRAQKKKVRWKNVCAIKIAMKINLTQRTALFCHAPGHLETFNVFNDIYPKEKGKRGKSSSIPMIQRLRVYSNHIFSTIKDS